MRNAVLALLGLIVIALVAWTLMRQKPPQITPSVHTATQEPELVPVPRTPLATAKQQIDKGSVLVIDVRDADSYIAGHIPGSLQIPLARIEGEVNYLPRDKPILTYCTWPAEESSARAALILRNAGFNASALLGGFRAWTDAGYGVKSGRER